MGNCSVIYREIRFNVDHEDVTDVYVLVDAKGDCPHTLPGWYHKQFLGLMPTAQLHAQIFTTEDMTPIYWEKRNPPDMVSDARVADMLQELRMARAWLQASHMAGGPVDMHMVASYLDSAIKAGER